LPGFSFKETQQCSTAGVFQVQQELTWCVD